MFNVEDNILLSPKQFFLKYRSLSFPQLRGWLQYQLRLQLKWKIKGPEILSTEQLRFESPGAAARTEIFGPKLNSAPAPPFQELELKLGPEICWIHSPAFYTVCSIWLPKNGNFARQMSPRFQNDWSPLVWEPRKGEARNTHYISL